MNLYLLLAIAFGAITGTTEVPVVRTARAGVAAECGVRVREQAAVSRVSPLHHARTAAAAPAETHAVTRIDAPLTGASSPRAPAANC